MATTNTGRNINAGVWAGLLAGIAMAMVAMIYSAMQGSGLFAPTKQIAAVFFGPDALVGGAGTIMVGMALHMMVSIMWGIIFGLIAGRFGAGSQFWFGMMYGAAVWLLMTFAVLPWLNPTMRDGVKHMPGAWFVAHLVFGGMLFLTGVFAHRHTYDRGETHISGAAHA